MSKLTHLKDKQGEAYVFHCPGCEMSHIIPISYPPEYANRAGRPKPTWAFNGNLKSPSFKPAFIVNWVGAEPPQRCHVIIRDGELIYLVESTHRLSGSRLKMVETE